ncbi:MAG: hypothetical protein ACM3S2_09250 [Ignavibacteriales bacterium]
MNRNLLRALIVGFIILISGSAFAQSGGLNFMLGFPQGEFKKSVDRTGYGIDGYVVFWNVTPSMPFTLGVNGSYMTYGSEDRREPFSSSIPDVTVNVSRTNNIASFHLLLQVMPPAGNFRPYIEGLVGGSYLFTKTEVNNEGNANSEIASSTNFDDWAWSYGGGGGIMFKVFEMPEKEGDNNGAPKLNSLWVDLKVRYLLGSEADYLKEGAVRIEQGKVIMNPSRSHTDMITAHIGVVFMF